jgi:glycosyltransferase involved in cell wall biosynthesis
MLAVGVPVVAEAVGQVPEYVVHWQTGVLRESGETSGMAADVVALLKDPPTRKRMGEAARAYIEQRFSWQGLAERLVKVYCGRYRA